MPKRRQDNNRKLVEMVSTYAHFNCMRAFEKELLEVATKAYKMGMKDAK